MLDPGGVFSSSFVRALFLSAGVGVSDLGRAGPRSDDLLRLRSSKSTNLAAVRSPLSGDRLSSESLSRLTLGFWTFCIRRFCARMMFLSGDRGAGLVVYELGAFSRALAVMRAAASSMRLDVLDLVIGLPGTPGFNGSGGGALSGSELSHLFCRIRIMERPGCALAVNSHRH
jgi:hypothetical protein